MKVTFDPVYDLAYIYLTSKDQIEVVNTYACDPIEVDGQINLDFDASGRLVGIEVMYATKKLPPDLLSQAEIHR